MTAMAAFGTICALVLLPVLRGFVLSVLWGWFVVPVFHLPVLVIPEALGIATLVSILTYSTCAQEKNEEWWAQLLGGISTSFLALGFGWIYKQFL